MTTKPENYETNSVETVIKDSGCSSTNPESCEKPPDTFSDLPPELRPDKDGNPPVITERLLRSLRGKYFTVRHVLLTDCGHKLDMVNEPRHRNCENCWWNFFNTHPQLVEVADQFFRTQGKKPMEGMRGTKWVQMFLRYMATVINFMRQEGRINEQGELQSPVVSEKSGTNSAGIEGEVSNQEPRSKATICSGLH